MFGEITKLVQPIYWLEVAELINRLKRANISILARSPGQPYCVRAELEWLWGLVCAGLVPVGIPMGLYQWVFISLQ